jgi:hypothetical protein
MSEIEHDLQEQVARGRRAAESWDLYIRDFCADMQETLFDSFLQTPLENGEAIMELKRLSMAIADLEAAVKRDIDAGKIAQAHLTELNNV